MPAPRSSFAILATVVVLASGSVRADEPAPAAKPKPRVDPFGDPLPAGALFRIGTTRLQHGSEVRAIAGSPDGKLLASVSLDGNLSVWDAKTGRELYRRQTGDPAPAKMTIRPPAASGFFSFTTDGKSLVLNKDGMLCLLDVETGEVRKQLGAFAHAGALSPDGKTLTAVQSDGGVWSPTVRRLDMATGKSLKEWQFEPEGPRGRGRMFDVEFTVTTGLSPDGNILATLETDRSIAEKEKQTIRLHDVGTGKELRRWQTPAHVIGLALTIDGKFLVTGSSDALHRVWDVSTGKEVRHWKGDPGEILVYRRFQIAMAPNGESLLSNGSYGLVRRDWRTGKELQTYPTARGPVAFLNGGKAVALVDSVNSIWVLDAETSKDLCPLPRPGHHVAFSPNGRLVAWPEDGALVLADAATGAEIRRWQAHDDVVGPLAFAPDGKTIASAGNDKRIRLWNVADGKELHSMPHQWVSRLKFAADGNRLASWYEDVCIWDVRTGKQQHHWRGDRLTTLDPGLRVVAVGDRKTKVLRLADAATGKMLHALPNYQEHVGYEYNQRASTTNNARYFPPLVAPDGRLLLAAGEVDNGRHDGAIYFWDVATGKRLPPLLDGKKFILSGLAFSPDSKLLALSRSDGMMCLMTCVTGKIVRVLGMGDGPMTAPPAFTPDGRIVVTVVRDLVQVWEVATAGEICRRQGHRGDVDGLVVSGDGRAFATLARDQTILVWDLARLVSDDRHTSPLAAVELDALWNELASPNAVKGRRAIETLVAVPVEAVALLRKRLPAVPVPDGKQLTRWIADLGADEFELRLQAAEALEQLGEAAGPALRQAIAGKLPLEARRRMESLLKKLHPGVLPPDALRVVRSVQVLEAIGSPEAQQLLQELGRGATGARLTEEAAEALKRLVR